MGGLKVSWWGVTLDEIRSCIEKACDSQVFDQREARKVPTPKLVLAPRCNKYKPVKKNHATTSARLYLWYALEFFRLSSESFGLESNKFPAGLDEIPEPSCTSSVKRKPVDHWELQHPRYPLAAGCFRHVPATDSSFILPL